MIYAPVLIPTMSRSNHLKRLIKSLQGNVWAKNTELYIGVDYPSENRYVKGHAEICEYLKRGIEGFKKVNIYYHKENLGESKNVAFLKTQIRVNYDRFIFTEDDNEFSPNFLEYINKGMEKYHNDENVVGICGHAYDINWELPEDTLLKVSCAYDGWGIGRWFSKDEKMYSQITLDNLERIMKNKSRAMNIRRRSPLIFYFAVQAVVKHSGDMFNGTNQLRAIDTTVSLFMMDRGYMTINPVLSKVRNWGDDGSGVHGGISNQGYLQVIDQNKYYTYSEDAMLLMGSFIDEKIGSKWYCDGIMKITSFIEWLIWWMKNGRK